MIRSISSLTDDDVKTERETEREMSFMHRTPLTSGMNERSFPSSSSSSSAMSGTDRTREFFATAERVSKQMTRGGGGEGSTFENNKEEENEGGATTTTTTTRTSGSDFYAAAKNNEFNDANGSSLRLANEAPTRKMKSLFHQRASQVGHAIHSTSQKLERLAQLAKRSGAFDDSSQEINTISFAVKEDIKELNTAIAELQRLALHEREQKTKQSTQHSETIVESLKGRLMDATKAFKDVLSERKENVKNNERRRSMFGGSGSSSLQTQQQQGGGFQGGTGRFASVSAAATTGSFMNVGARSSEQQQGEQQGNFGHMNPISFNQNQVAVYQDQDQNYATSRADAMQNVERTITELGGIFQQLATMVNEQGEMAIRIDENVEDVVANVDQAQGELLKYLNYISNNRWLAMKVFGVLMAFLMFFIVFVA